MRTWWAALGAASLLACGGPSKTIVPADEPAPVNEAETGAPAEEPLPPPGEELSRTIGYDLHVFYRNVTEIAVAEAAWCDWTMQTMMNADAVLDEPPPGGVDSGAWDAARSELERAVGEYLETCGIGEDGAGAMSDVKASVEAMVRLAVAASAP
jgi:hypothetical protein